MCVATIGLFLYALLIDPYIDIPPDAQVDTIKGPWFFLGIQTLLELIPTLWASLFIPATGTGLGKAIHFSTGPFSHPEVARVFYHRVMCPFFVQ